MPIPMSIPLCLFPCLSLYAYSHVYPSMPIPMYIPLCLFPCISLYAYSHVYPSMPIPMYISLCLFPCRYICSICLIPRGRCISLPLTMPASSPMPHISSPGYASCLFPCRCIMSLPCLCLIPLPLSMPLPPSIRPLMSLPAFFLADNFLPSFLFSSFLSFFSVIGWCGLISHFTYT